MNKETPQHRRIALASARGSSVVGLTLLTPIMAMSLFFVVAAGRIGVVESKLVTAAHSAARAATQHHSASAAKTAATTAATASLTQLGAGCHGGPRIRIEELNLQPGGSVQLQISCAVRLTDLALPGLSGELKVSASARSVVDQYRSESP